MIRHSVILKLKNTLSQDNKQAFFDAVDTLVEIPNVQKFEVLKQTSQKNKFEYGISMEFDNQEQYDHYSNHPIHQLFIQNFWMNSVEDFLEIDYEKMD
ncbi:stress responsive alpha/beta barrel protein [Arcicella aurantiaca]|uniref:Stress responsive alpha/beta barrel protein n=1 Tax=Arcicella aurantiaca TaxID=591202 RepID=A0A316E763_9BACT|nr:Dabb family protein [Arcicella aurantiaca]PWK18790.1 stress responsive alpha/beta barrel protein [Arcicella aurantiaca]